MRLANTFKIGKYSDRKVCVGFHEAKSNGDHQNVAPAPLPPVKNPPDFC